MLLHIGPSLETQRMRYALDHKAQTHQRIVKEASMRFRRDGIGATGLQPLMKALGLTHGGFYAHFKSKDDLVEQALSHALDNVKGITSDVFARQDSLSEFIDLYLSLDSRDPPDGGCPLPTMCLELGQRDQPSATTDKIILHLLELFDQSLSQTGTESKSLPVLSTLVGGVVLARSAFNEELSQRILDTTRDYLKQEIKKSAN
ncbi:Transcriptional regulator, TetR family [Pseudomonas savastanoi pv. glycinea]|uniref:Transcriptional regulator, TetR family n=10 Tax=Pseudomonas syringae group genomosp. 2 TaxID=251698 RepID=A0AAX1W0V9_PSEAJ|nr:Transcriptional regulator, TetR family [Pseudomonas savastanoi pv. phaseolicola]KPY83281.1 Transcriptional regulator, TetR family [Pseudomonas amygdali pv. tabaci]RMM46519.1 Transcriptional regulator, TetR family [Pseudomonas amygdali pv. lachrymans]RMM63847.1 Transcriptional regulator, TetR family [Pseudomonas savastanoi pv. glycinea]RML83762.1 Transcriptional regulator, TetR family [Pseudomonas amygdali pv. tabaci]